MASIVGTTGAAMILIRPLIRANVSRRHNVHVMVFFIILVANVGGALSPLGDPPLFIGFLNGVDFFWTTRNLWVQTAIVAVLLLAGTVPFFLGLAVVIPLLGHATWHLYREVIVPDPTARPVIPPARPRKPAADFPANLFPWKRG